MPGSIAVPTSHVPLPKPPVGAYVGVGVGTGVEVGSGAGVRLDAGVGLAAGVGDEVWVEGKAAASPQQTTVASVLMPQVKKFPALIDTNSPSGGVA